MSPPWSQRKTKLLSLLESDGDEEKEGLALDRLLHGQAVIGKTPKTVEVDDLRFSDKDLDVVGTLAHGQFGTVELVNCRLDGRVYVRKRIEKKTAIKTQDQCSPQIERDILLLALKSKTVWAPHILCAFQTPVHLSLVMQYAEGGSLWDVLESSPEDGKLCHEDLAWWVPQCISAINWCHMQGFVHRDIKPHNFVLSPSAQLLLIDFGSAAPLLPPRTDGVQLVPNRHCLVPCGTCDYISPEILNAHEEALIALEMADDDESRITATRRASESEGKGEGEGGYGRETDWWSLGAMVYEMTYGAAPFFARDIGQTYLRIMQHETSLKFDSNVSVASDLKALLRGLLSHHERRLGRHGIYEIMEQPLFKHVNWDSLHTLPAPSALHLPQFTYATPHSSLRVPDQPSFSDHSSSKAFAFSALFQSSRGSSPGLSILRATPARGSISASDHQAVASFIGFSWGPPRNAFDHSGDDKRMATTIVANNTYRSTTGFDPLLHVDGAEAGTPGLPHFATPIRPTTLSLQHTLPRTGTVRRTAQRRAVSDREAMQQLVNCVGMSARKRVLESGRKPRSLPSALAVRRRRSSFTLKKELRFDAASVPDLVVDTASTSVASSNTEEPLSPSPSPRPGSAMSVLSRRSVTPTATMTGSFPSLRDPSRSLSVASGRARSSYARREYSSAPPDSDLEELERRYTKLVRNIDDIEKRFDFISIQLRQGYQ